MTQQPAPAPITTDPALNWATLRIILDSDIRIYSQLAARYIAGSTGRARCDARVEQAQAILDSMDQIENPARGLAEHTEAACDTITRAAR